MTTPEAALADVLMGDADFGPEVQSDCAGHILAALHDAGYALTPLAPEVPPRRDGLREAVEAQITGLLSISEPLSPIERGNLGAYQDVLNLIDRLAATRNPEPPDSGDGAAPQRKWGRRWNDGLWPVDEPRAARIDAAREAVIERARGMAGYIDGGIPVTPGLDEALRLYDRLRSGSPAPEGGE